MNDKLELAERCERATGPDRELDALIDCALRRWPEGWSPDNFIVEAEFHPVSDGGRDGIRPLIAGGMDTVRWDAPSYTASLDAAMTLVPEGFDWAVFRTNGGLTVHAWCGDREDVFGETPALALCAAALRSRASGEPRHD